jgi:hypothetical protein
MGLRRMTRLTNAFSKKVENLEHAVTSDHCLKLGRGNLSVRPKRMSAQEHFYQRVIDVSVLLLIVCYFIWMGFKQKAPAKILGINSRVYYFLGAALMFGGLIFDAVIAEWS